MPDFLGTLKRQGVDVLVQGTDAALANSGAAAAGVALSGAPVDHRHAVGVGAIGVSTMGNTLGDTGLRSGTVYMQGGNNVTLSQITGAGSIATVVISAGAGGVPIGTAVKPVASIGSTGTITRYAPEDHQHAGLAGLGVSNVGNTLGNTGSTLGTVVFQGGNNITLSQITAAAGLATIIVSAANETQTVAPIATAVKAVSSIGSTGTITRFAPEDHQHAGVAGIGVSNVGNTLGNTGSTLGTVVLQGGNNITLSQITAANGQATVIVSAANETQVIPTPATTGYGITTLNTQGTVTQRYALEDHFHFGVWNVGLSNIGNTAGTSGPQPGRIIFAGGNNVTLSQSTNATGATITVSAANETQTVPPIGTAVKAVSTIGSTGTITRFAPEDHQHIGINSAGVSNLGNTVGNTGVNPGRIVFQGGNNVTLSQLTDATGSTVIVSAANETQVIPPIGTAVKAVASIGSTGTITRYAPEDHQHAGVAAMGVSNVGNTSGNTGTTLGTVVFQGGDNVTLSQITAGAGLATILISAPTPGAGGPGMTAGISNIGNTSGTSGTVTNRIILAGGNNITLSQSTAAGGNTITISGPNIPGPATVYQYDNLQPIAFSSVAFSQNSLLIFPLAQPNDMFPGVMTADTFRLNISNSGTPAGSQAVTFRIGIYTIVGSSTLSLLNSGSTAYVVSGSTGAVGARWLTINSSNFSTALTFSNTSYFIGIHVSTASTAPNLSFLGWRLQQSAALSGTFGVNQNASNTTQGWYPWAGILSVSTGAIPASIHVSNISKVGSVAAALPGFMPRIQLGDLLSVF